MVPAGIVSVCGIVCFNSLNNNQLPLHLCREISVEILSPLPVGSFLVRCSESRIDSLALSVKVPNSTIVHYLITSGSHGWKIKVWLAEYVESISILSS